MKNMKKLWAALLALAMTFSLAACGGTSDEDAATDDQPTGEEVSGDTAPESDVPEWGCQEERGIDMEVETAAACLAYGSDAVILKHPESIKTVAQLIAALM